MNKTVKVTGLQVMLNAVHPYLKAIASGTVKLAEGVMLNIPDQSDLAFAATDNPDVIRCTFNGVTADIDMHAFFGLIPIQGREPVTFINVGPSSIQTLVSLAKITAVDDGGGS